MCVKNHCHASLSEEKYEVYFHQRTVNICCVMKCDNGHIMDWKTCLKTVYKKLR